MTELLKFVMEKAFFDKKDVIKLIETLPENVQEDAFLIASGAYKIPEYCRIGTKGVINGGTYVVTSFNPFEGVTVQNINNTKDFCTITFHETWKKYVDNHINLIKKRRESYYKQLRKVQEEYKDVE